METPKKLIQELSDLTRNLDVLAKEIRDSNKINSESQKTLSKNLEISAKKKPETSDKPGAEANQNKDFLENLRKTIKDSLPDVGKIAGKTEEPGKGQTTKDLVSAVVGKFPNIPKMASGGKVSSPGVALVGEKGPEVVQLQKGDKVNPLDKMSQSTKTEEGMFLEMLARDEKEKKEGSAEIVSGAPKLGEFVKNAFGVKVPKSEIDSERKKLYEGDKEYYDEYPEDLEDDVQQFIKSYRETMSASDVQKLSVPFKPKEAQKPEEDTQKKEAKGIENTGGELQKKPANKKFNLKESLMGLGEKIKGGAAAVKSPEALNPEGEAAAVKTPEALNPKVGATSSTDEGSPKKSFKEMAKEEFGKTKLGSTVNSISSLIKKKKDEPVADFSYLAESEMKKEELALKSEASKGTSSSAPTEKSPEAATPETKSSEKSTSPSGTPASTSTPTSSNPPSSSGSTPSTEGISSQDIQDIKSLLSSINTTLSGPLRIKDNKPFRPKSSMLE